MDENRIAGTAKNIAGKAQESFGRVVGDAKTQVEGIANQVAGALRISMGRRAKARPRLRVRRPLQRVKPHHPLRVRYAS